MFRSVSYGFLPKCFGSHAIIGNPPYQVTVEGNGRAKPVYHLFIDFAIQLSPCVSLISPARYLFNVGFTPTEWNQKMLNDEHVKIVWYKPNSRDVFPSVDIKGGVAVTFRDELQNFGKIGIYKPFSDLDRIIEHIGRNKEKSLVEIVFAESSYRFDTSNDYTKQIVEAQLGGDKKLISNLFEKLPEECHLYPGNTTIQVYGRFNNRREIRHIRRSLLEPHPNLDYWKVFVAESNGAGEFGEALSSPFIGEPHDCATQTFLSIGAFSDRFEAEACLKYIKTKFARTMLGVIKVTQHNPKDTWRLVPLQDFTSASDIDWTQEIEQIDRQLYRKYGLTPQEIAFIEEKVKPMQ